MENPLPPHLRSGHIYIEDAQSNEKSYIRFLFFELWLIAFEIYGHTRCTPDQKEKICPKLAKFIEKMHIEMTMIF